MGFFDSKKIKELSEQVKALQQRNNFQSLAENIFHQIAIYPDYNIRQNAERYVHSDDVYSIVRMLSTTAALIPLRGYLIKDDNSAKQLKRLVQPHKVPLKVKALMIKALDDLSDDDPLNKLLENPSDTLSKFEFFEGVYTNLFLNGESFILKERPELGVNAGTPTNLILLNPANVIIKISDPIYRVITGYDYRVAGRIIYENIPIEDMIHLKYYNPDVMFIGFELRGLSPIKVLSRRLVQMDVNNDVQTAQMQNGGIETIVYDNSPNDNSAIDINGTRKDNFYRFLKNPQNAGAPFFASGSMGAVNLGSTLADMEVIESAGINFKKLCNAFGTSDVLFNNGEASTESNVQEMVMRTYTNTVLPNVYRVRDALKKGLLPDFNDGEQRDIREDISEISELQPNTQEMATWLNIAWWVPRNDALEMMRFERNSNPIFDQPLIPPGYQTPEDLVMIPDLPLETPNGN